MIWRSLGRTGVVARLQEQIRLLNLLAEWIKKDPCFELSAQPSMGVVCFRFTGDAVPSSRAGTTPRGEAGSIDRVDAINSDIVERINASGRAYLTQTKLRARTAMRIGLGNVLTREEHLRKGWEIIQETAELLTR
jgi:aromatic-L-amino-acid decarboxylase